MVWTGLIGLSIGTSSCEHSNEPQGSIKCWEVLKNCTTGSFSLRAQLREVRFIVSCMNLLISCVLFSQISKKKIKLHGF
jgi:hypothetical protein